MAKQSSFQSKFQPPVEKTEEPIVSKLIEKLDSMSPEEIESAKFTSDSKQYLARLRNSPLFHDQVRRAYSYAGQINLGRTEKRKTPIDSDRFALEYILSHRIDPSN